MIIVKNLDFKYKDKRIFHNLNFIIESGQWISIIGENGSGKSTLAKILTGLLQFQKGEILINNFSLNEDNLIYLRSLIGIIFQNPDYQFVGFDVRSDIAFGLENKKFQRSEILEKIKKYSAMLGIEDLLYKKPQELSGGQKQKVSIASVLAMEPEIIIFDEPTAFLDPKGAKEIQNIIQNIHKQKNKILITITHDFSFALKSDKIMLLQEGFLLKYEKSHKFLKDFDFLYKFFPNLPLSLQLYFLLFKDRKIDTQNKNKKFFNKLKDALWQYILKM
ncbi:ATP-binding cassette domain-containing protein [Texas Phoenix palm phytoplasma]|uniref:ATP-binding cassette domain-containing protein n=1 Tax=Texas Phoenix palm phytoplasma TaxID=176709 RepID=A0ABS5BIH9_9MOLU|nr:ATP-binding cassette domain-containing protein [Texas Phoenix palm phytoplasma]MBP3059391.1 ATP-binding cassette domain-containing protein [Texas Phoenix palm phytoplasma]